MELQMDLEGSCHPYRTVFLMIKENMSLMLIQRVQQRLTSEMGMIFGCNFGISLLVCTRWQAIGGGGLRIRRIRGARTEIREIHAEVAIETTRSVEFTEDMGARASGGGGRQRRHGQIMLLVGEEMLCVDMAAPSAWIREFSGASRESTCKLLRFGSLSLPWARHRLGDRRQLCWMI